MTTIKLCGRLQVRLDGREVTLPGRQGRAVFAYLVVNRRRAVSRDELLELLWPAAPPADPGETLSALLSRVRRALGPGVLVGREELGLALPADASIDFAAALDAADRAEAGLARADPGAARDAAREALEIADGGFLTGDDLPWVEERRRDLAELRLRALEALAAAGAALGGGDLAAAERAARELVHTAPFRESGHRLLMAALAARGDVAEALRVYEELRCLLRDELGAVPGRAVLELHERLLSDDRPAAQPAELPREEAQPAPPPRDERKVVTVLVAELAELAGGGGDPEDLWAATAPRVERLREELEGFGGTVARFVGTVAIAVFGLHRTREDDPERSVAAAVRICAPGEPPGVRPLAARAGLATGEAIVSLGGPQAEPLTGELVTSALRLQEAAPTGGVVVDESTYRATSAGVDYEQLNGAWRVTSLRPARRRSAPTPFVGRSHELGVLEDLYLAGVEDERPRLVTVFGSAGVGKTRLVEEFLRRAAAGRSPPAVHRGRCLSYGEGITYWALREILWGAAGILLGDTSAATAGKLIGLVRRLLDGPDGERAARALAIGSGISLAENPLEGTSPESIAEELGLAWPMFLSALAAERPTIVVIEDLHWAEPPLLDMLDRIVSRLSGSLLLVTTARPELAEARPGWSVGPGRSQLALEPLTEAQTGALLEALLPAADPGLREAVGRTAEGNPFFAEEIVAHLGDRTVLVAGCPAPGELTPLPIPGTVRAVLAARIDALPEAEKRVLQDASVVGRTFWATTLESMRADASIRPSLRALEEKGLVSARPSSALPDQPEFSFRHALIREVAYRSVPRQRRCRAHASVADWLERLARDRRGEFVDLLAHHYEAAANPADAAIAWPADGREREDVRAKAVEALVDAGWAARQRFQTEQALRYAGRTLALARDDVERLAALELEAAALHAAVRADEALSSYLEALRLARALGASDRVSRLRAEATLLCSRYVGAFSGQGWERAAAEIVEQGLAEVGEQGVDFETGALSIGKISARVDFETGALLIGRVSTPRWLGSPPSDTLAARRDARRAIEIAEAIDSPYLLAAAYHALYKVVIADGLCECAEVADRMQRAAQRMRDRVEAHEGLVVASTSFFWAGRFEAARAAADRAVAEAAALTPHRRLHAVCVQAICLGTDGRIPEVLEATAEVPELIRQDAGHTCPYGVLALARRAVSLFELEERQAAGAAVELLRRAAPRQRAAAFVFRAAELLRPFVGLEGTGAFLETIGGRPLDSVDDFNRLRLELQLRALSADVTDLDRLIAGARERARPACAPFIGWLADWAEAVALIRSGAVERGLPLARGATSELDAYGERYTAARLLVDLLPWLDAPAAEEVAAQAAARLEAMGARASAAQARAGRLSKV